MKKLILKIVSIAAAFLLGVIGMSYYQTAGNNDLTGNMADAYLPLVYAVRNGEQFNLMHGHTQPMEAGYMRDAVMPLSEERRVELAIQSFGSEIEAMFYEVRSLDMERLIEDAQITDYSLENGFLKVGIQLKDLLDPGAEYQLILRLVLEDGTEASYYMRLWNGQGEHLPYCLDFIYEIHEATFDKENKVSITQYLESDSSADNNTLDRVTIHSRYRQIIWGDMEVEPAGPVRTYITELEGDVTSVRLEYEVSHVNDRNETERYEVCESYRVRYTKQRMYLLDYDRTMDRIFDPELQIFSKDMIELGILNTDVEYKKNEEENVVGFVQNGELWCYDTAQNKLSYVFGFRKGEDLRCSYGEHAIKIIEVNEAGSMQFLVYGYMNRGIHEGETGVGVYTYNAMTNSVEERAFIPSSRPFQVLKTELGELAYINDREQLYLYLGNSIGRIDLNTREYIEVIEDVSEEACMISDDGRSVAWHRGNSLYGAETIELMDLETGRRREISASEGFYIRALGFMGTDFIYGEARKEDVVKDISGNLIFPMGYVIIQDESGEIIREFPYEDQGKYVVSISIESNRISLECVVRTANGSYEETSPEPITNKTTEIVEKIELDTRNSTVKKREYVFKLSAGRAEAAPRYLTPKQVLFEGNRDIVLEKAREDRNYYVYAFDGRLVGAYTRSNEAVREAYEYMGVVVDETQSYIWKRGGRKTRTELTGLENLQQKEGETSLQAALEILLSEQNVYADVGTYLAEGYTAHEILDSQMEAKVLDLSGCSVSMTLHYVSEGYPVLALESETQAELITGYDPQNIILTDPLTGESYKKGMNDSTQMFEELGNVFVAYLPAKQ